MVEQVRRVMIGMDPHKRSVTIEVMLADETVVGGGRFGTTVEGYQAMLGFVATWPDRVWAIEGCEGIGRHIAHRLLADGQDIQRWSADVADHVRAKEPCLPAAGWQFACAAEAAATGHRLPPSRSGALRVPNTCPIRAT